MKVNLNITYVYVINSDAKMTKGKVAAQVSHCAMQLGKDYDTLGRAIILKAPEMKLHELLALMPDSVCIHDAGLNQVVPNTLTCVAFRRYIANPLIKNLKLY